MCIRDRLPITKETANSAVKGGNIDIVTTIFHYNQSLLENTHHNAIITHHNDILEFLFKVYNWTYNTDPDFLLLSSNIEIFNYFIYIEKDMRKEIKNCFRFAETIKCDQFLYFLQEYQRNDPNFFWDQVKFQTEFKPIEITNSSQNSEDFSKNNFSQNENSQEQTYLTSRSSSQDSRCGYSQSQGEKITAPTVNINIKNNIPKNTTPLAEVRSTSIDNIKNITASPQQPHKKTMYKIWTELIDSENVSYTHTHCKDILNIYKRNGGVMEVNSKNRPYWKINIRNYLTVKSALTSAYNTFTAVLDGIPDFVIKALSNFRPTKIPMNLFQNLPKRLSEKLLPHQKESIQYVASRNYRALIADETVSYTHLTLPTTERV